MIQLVFDTVRRGQIKAEKLKAKLALSYTMAICPPDMKPVLGRCLKEAEDFRVRLMDMIARNSDELEFVILQSGCAEQAGLYPSYDSFLDFFKNLDEDEEYPHTNYLSRTARNFIKNFDELPENVADALNRCLKPQLELIELHFTVIFRRAVLEAFELR